MNLLVISSYPEKSLVHGNKTVGVGNYTKATLLALLRANPDFKIRVLAEVLDEKENYIENKIEVKRFWKRSNFLSILFLFIRAAFDKSKLVFLPLEMYMFGGYFMMIFLPVFLLLLRISGKKVVLVLHQVMGTDFSPFERNKIKVILLDLGKKIFYGLLTLLCNKVVVFERELKERLGAGSNHILQTGAPAASFTSDKPRENEKVIVIPHAVIQENILNKKSARENLGLDPDKKYVFYFGFITQYKGIDKLINIWDHIDGVELIIGGGGNPNHINNPVQKNYIETTIAAAQAKNIVTTGFIPEDQMGTYFSAVDIVILPYTVFMSSSGPLSHAFSYGDGVLLSTPLKAYFMSADMRKALIESGISEEEICFDLDKPIRSKVLWAVHNLDKLQKFSLTMREERSWDRVGRKYNEVLLSI